MEAGVSNGLYDYTEAQAARVLGVCDRTLRDWRKRGYIDHYQLPGGRIRYSNAHLMDFHRSTYRPARTIQPLPHSAG